MKDVKEVVACIWDAGTFVSLAKRLSEDFGKVYYYSPWESEYLEVDRCVIGDGEPAFERLDEPLDPEVLPSIDLFIFPDIGFAGIQRHLRSLGKAVWGSMRGTNLELYRSDFIRVIEKAGLPLIGSKVIHGVTALSDHLKEVKNKWVKVNRFRGNMETWHHRDYDHSRSTFDHLATVFGGVKERVTFVVQDAIDDEEDSPVVEIGYDGWCIDGQYPESSFQGYEAKNELYLGSLKKYDELPEELAFINEKMALVLERYGYRNFWATEIRLKDGVPYFIDPTARMPGQTGEQILITCDNLGEVMWAGGNGELAVPNYNCSVAAEATIHYHSDSEGGWKFLRVPEEVEDSIKLYQYCVDDDGYHFPPGKNDEVGVVCGRGEDIASALTDLKENFDLLKEEPVSIDFEGFVELVEQIETAQEEGMKFTDEPLPEPAEVVEVT